MKKMIIALATLAFCGVAIASSGPLFRSAWRTEVQFAKGSQHGGGGSASSGFTSASNGINSNGFLYVTFKDNVGQTEAGASVTYTFTGKAAASWVCATGGGGKGRNQATGAVTSTYNDSDTDIETVIVPNNGTVSSGLDLAPAPAPPSGDCSGTWELGAVTYLLATGSLTDSLGNTADNAMTGPCSIGSTCSQVFVSGVSAPTIQ